VRAVLDGPQDRIGNFVARSITRGIRRMMDVSFIMFLYICGNRYGRFFPDLTQYSTQSSAA
jgi:hypothetical protein